MNSCEKTKLLSYLQVHYPQALKSDAWKEHLIQCPFCCQERNELSLSLSIYKQIDALDAFPQPPSWSTIRSQLKSRRKYTPLMRYLNLTALLLACVSLGVGVGSYYSEQPSLNVPPLANSAPPQPTNDSKALQADTGNITQPLRQPSNVFIYNLPPMPNYLDSVRRASFSRD